MASDHHDPLIITIHWLASSLCLLSTSKLVCGGRSGAIWLPSHHPGGCCTLEVYEEIPPLLCKVLWAPETDLQWGPRHLDIHRGKTPGTSGALTLWLCCSWNKLLIRLAGGEMAPRLSLVSPKVFSPFCHRWSFRSLPLSPVACLVGDTSLAAQSSTWLHRYYLNWTKLDNAITKFNNEMHSADKLSVKSCHFTLLTQFAYFDIVQCFVTICIVKSAI